MKLNIAFPATGCCKTLDIDQEAKLRPFFDKKLSEEVKGDEMGDEFKGYVFKIVGGQDKEGFPMKQGVLSTSRVRLLLPRGSTNFQKWRGRSGERRRKSIRGCLVGPDLAVLHLVIVKKGDQDLAGITTEARLRTHGPKRASKIRKLFGLEKSEDVRKYVVKHQKKVGKKDAKTTIQKGPKIQRLITKERIARKKRTFKLKLQNRKTVKATKTAFEELVKKRKAESAAKKQ